jgi:hypothetical protein
LKEHLKVNDFSSLCPAQIQKNNMSKKNSINHAGQLYSSEAAAAIILALLRLN